VAPHELERLHEHTARTAAGIVDLALVRLDHLRDEVNHALGCIELAPKLALCGGKLAQEIFIDPANHVLFLILHRVDIVDRINQGRELTAIQAQAGEIVVRQRTLERGIALLHRRQGRVDLDRDIVLLGVLLNIAPAGSLRQVEDVLHGVELHHIDVFLLPLRDQLRPPLLKLVRNKFKEDQTQHHVFIFGRLHATPQPVGGIPQEFFEPFIIFRCNFFPGHY